MGKNHLYISLYQHGIPLCYSCQIFYDIYYIRMHLLFFYNRILRAVYLQLLVIGWKQRWIKIQVYYLIFFFPKHLIMMYYIREHDCKIALIHMVQFLSNSKLNIPICYIHYLYCFM